MQEEIFCRIDAPFRKQSFILLAKGVDTMMFLLVHDVAAYHLLVTLAIGESGISVTPTGKQRELLGLRLQPLGGFCFQYLHEVADGNVGADRDEHVDMVGYPANADELALLAFAEAEDVCIEIAVMRLGEGAFAALGAPDDVVI